ncbi:hypothetical protein KOEU_37870 [Komagataeibacter europaeus]|uniref:Uncharacterized protein n=1 Tax=Komagataeibacter europaeus TaxID=33995 RepID=A0A0M0EBW3_KOMEU|nr:hypothetical protein KOEU_37870 [Komagataeibacter europaeus]
MKDTILGLVLFIVLSTQSGLPVINLTGNTFQVNVTQTK